MCGPPIWVDHDTFAPDRHMARMLCPKPGDERALLDAVLPYMLKRLPRDRPLWRAVAVDGLAGGRTTLILIMHHVLTDGLGGLAVLHRLMDGADRVATVNSALRTAVAEALRQVFDRRGETINTVKVAVPAGEPRVDGGMAGNAVAPWWSLCR